MLAHSFNVLFYFRHLFLVAQDTDNIISCNDSQLREEGLNHLEMPVANSIEDYRVYVLKNYMLFYQCCLFYIMVTKLLQKSEMRKDIVIELSYKGFSCASDYS